MTDLQLGLAIIGALAVVAVLAYNRWQERSARRAAERAFSSQHADVLGDARREPTLAPAPEPRRRAALAANALPNERVDYVIEVTFGKPASPVALGEAWAPIGQRFAGRAIACVQEGADWHRLEPGAPVQHMRAALQLVSRAGVVSDAELLEFRSAVETLAASLGGTARAPEMRAALEAARELDRTCAEVDIQVALHVVGGSGGEVPLEGQPFQATARPDGVTLTLDVARTGEPARSYEAMARTGRQLAQERGARLVDDNGRELDERALAAVGRQLDTVRERLAACGIEPGSPLALRVFS